MARLLLSLVLLAGCRPESRVPVHPEGGRPSAPRPEEDWRSRLSPLEYEVLREKGTEPPFTGRFHAHKEKGLYVCRGCGRPLFSSEAKFDSGTGWPSFTSAVSSEAVAASEDRSFGMRRTELHCPACGGHLGHVFDDGPPPTGLRYCINSASLDFTPAPGGRTP